MKVIIQNRERFIFQTKRERKLLEQARDYFHSARLLLTEGLGYTVRVNPAHYYQIKNGKSTTSRKDGNKGVSSISIENFRRIEEYASRHERGEEYDSETFIRPEF